MTNRPTSGAFTNMKNRLKNMFTENEDKFENDLEAPDNSSSSGTGFADGIRGLVSKQKRRIKVDGFDLDMTYM